MVKSKLPPCSVSVALKQLSPSIKRSHKVIFYQGLELHSKKLVLVNIRFFLDRFEYSRIFYCYLKKGKNFEENLNPHNNKMF